MRLLSVLPSLLLLAPSVALADPGAGGGGAAEAALSVVLMALAILVAAGKAGAEAAVRLGQPPVLGELCAGIVLGNCRWSGSTASSASAPTRPSGRWPSSA